ncbi:unnamed protein product [Malus baccata var. baccata]
MDTVLSGDASARFSLREAEKLHFLGDETLIFQRQWWEFKSKHMDKVLFFKVVKREICAVLTKGTLTEGEMVSANPDASYLMTVTENSQNLANQTAECPFGVCVVDVATSRVILGQFGDDLECSALSCLLSELRSVEIVNPAKLLSPETEKVQIRHTRSPLVNELVPLSEFWDAERTVQEVRSTYRHADDQLVYGSPKNASFHASDSHLEEDGYGCLPEVLSEMVRAGEDGISALSALGGTLFYLKQAFLDETLLRFAKFEFQFLVLGVNLPYALEFRKVISRLLDMERLLVYVSALVGIGLPEVNSVLKHFKDAFDWVEANNSGRIIPHEGVDIEYDSACEKVKEIESHLAKHLQEQRKLLGDKSGFSKYWTPDIKKSLTELSLAETDKESSLKSILQRFIRRFCEHQIDVLISLAIASDCFEGPSCQPVAMSSSCSNEVPRYSAKRKGTFVSNDIAIGGSGHASFTLLTGPNMGGRSTLIRQQLGAELPPESFELSPVDRIFVCMGAKDNIMVALDELGRGTSTSDGQAIAESVLEHFIYKVQCRGMFSTLYHRLAVDYQNNSKVSLCHMACQVGNGDGGVEDVTFLYSACPKSYGVNIARLAGKDLCLVLLSLLASLTQEE